MIEILKSFGMGSCTNLYFLHIATSSGILVKNWPKKVSRADFAFGSYKVGIFPMVISSEFRMSQYRDDDHREDAPHFI